MALEQYMWRNKRRRKAHAKNGIKNNSQKSERRDTETPITEHYAQIIVFGKPLKSIVENM